MRVAGNCFGFIPIVGVSMSTFSSTFSKDSAMDRIVKDLQCLEGGEIWSWAGFGMSTDLTWTVMVDLHGVTCKME
jgi:hypothetical protein